MMDLMASRALRDSGPVGKPEARSHIGTDPS